MSAAIPFSMLNRSAAVVMAGAGVPLMRGLVGRTCSGCVPAWESVQAAALSSGGSLQACIEDASRVSGLDWGAAGSGELRVPPCSICTLAAAMGGSRGSGELFVVTEGG